MHSIVIIGSGLAGYNLAREIRKHDSSVPLTIITANDGQYYSKPQLSTALTQKKAPEQLAMMSADQMRQQLKAEILTQTEVQSIDTASKTLATKQGGNIQYEQLVLAWGAEVIQPQLQGNALDSIYAINELQDYEAFRAALHHKKRVAILGAGLIGCEFANDLLNVDISVDIISLADRPLDTLLEKTASHALAHALEKKGARWHWQTSIREVNQTSDGIQLILESGKIIDCDLLVSAIGIRPRTALASQANIQVNQGVIVNEFLKTSQDSVYALGDCAEVCGHVYQYILPISHEVKALAKTLTGQATPVEFPAMPISIKTPACPIVTVPAPSSPGQWKIEAAGEHVRAIFEDAKDKTILGFILTGDRVKERLQLTTLVPPLMSHST